MKTFKFILNLFLVIGPIGYALYTKNWSVLLLVVWGFVGALAGIIYEKTNIHIG